MAISDSAGNPLLAGPGATGPMLGFIAPTPADAVLALKMYDFLIRPIRTADRTRGRLFVQRYLEGPQAVWETVQTDIFRLLDLWDVVRIPDALLQFLKNIVGWTPDLERPITDRLSDADLRRLISVSVALWKIRGLEGAYSSAILALVLTRVRIWNWDDLNWILDVTVLGEDHQGRDPFLLSSVAEYQSDIRIVDGALELDRTLILNMLKLFRVSGETLNVYWIDFLDQFLVDGDDSQWAGSVDPVPVADRLLALTDDTGAEDAHVIVDDSLTWTRYVAYWRLKGGGDASGERFGAMFYWQDDDNYYRLDFDPVDDTIYLVERKATAEATLASFDLTTVGLQVHEGVFYGVRIHVETVPGGTRIRVYLDAVERIDFTDGTAPLTRGSAGVVHTTGSTVELYELELYQLPLASNTITINETP